MTNDNVSNITPARDIDIERGNLTISQFMSQHGLEGGVSLEDSDADSTASAILTDKDGRRYKMGGMVAKGGMGMVLNAKDLNIRRTVAMKVMLDPKTAAEDKILRFILEAQVTGQLEHPSVVPVHELGVDAHDNVFYTMKLVKGVTLQDIVSGIRDGDPDIIAEYPLTKLLNIFLKVCDAIAFAHTKGVVHRDLKPENIMVGDYGEVLVMDWGLAKILAKDEGERMKDENEQEALGSGAEITRGARDSVEQKPGWPMSPAAGPSDPSDRSDRSDADFAEFAIDSLKSDDVGQALMTMDGQIMGTPLFMAPEQAHGRISQIDSTTDIYSLGAILYNILTLHHHVEGKTVQQILLKISKGDIAPPTVYNSSTTTTAAAQREEKPKLKTIRDAASLAKRAAQSSMAKRKAERAEKTPELPALPRCPGNRIPSSLSAVTMKALALNQDNRYQSVKQLQTEIEKHQGGFATEAEEAGLWTQLMLLTLMAHFQDLTLNMLKR